MDFNRIRFKKSGVQSVLSPLEADIMKVLWSRDGCKVRDIHSTIAKSSNAALTSIAVSLDRLHTRGVVLREVENGRGGPHYIYRPSQGREEFEKSIVDSAVNGLIEIFGKNAVAYFNERFGRKR